MLARKLTTSEEVYVAGQLPPEPKALLRWQGRQSDLIRDYKRAFEQASPDRLRIEKSTSYSDHLHVAPLLRTLLPDTKVLFLVRDPVDRLISNYRWSVQNGMESRPLRVAVEGLTKPSIGLPPEPRPHDYLWRSLFGNHLKSWLRYWPRDQIHVSQLERLMAFPTREFASITTFINIAPISTGGEELQRVNAAISSSALGDADLQSATEPLRGLVRDYICPDVEILQGLNFDVDLSLWSNFLRYCP